MTTPSLSQDTLSLKQGCNRQAISLLARFDRRSNLLDFRFVPSVIRVRRQLTYEEVNENLSTEDLLQEIYQISQSLRQKRMNEGALSLSLPELQVNFNEDSSLSLELVDQNTPSRIIVAECMILYNWLAAGFCRDNQIPVLFRTQQEPNETFSVDEAGYNYYVFKQRRKLSPLQIDTVPNPHSGLGLDAYTQASSPIRRYLDLVIQRQLGGFLAGTGPVYDEDELEQIRLLIAPVIKNLERIKRNRLRYWILKYISQHRNRRYKALVLYELKHKYRVVLNECLLIAEIKRQDGVIHAPGEEISVEVRKVDPWDDLLELTYVDE
jgi:exoribonuclease-2